MLRSFLITVAVGITAAVAFAQSPENVVPTSRPPSDVVLSYVRNQPLPQNPVQVTEIVVVGSRVADTLELSPIPDSPTYAFIVINQDRLIVDATTRLVVTIVE